MSTADTTDQTELPPAVAAALTALRGLSADDVAAFEEAVADDPPAALKGVRSRFFAAGKKEVESKDLRAAKRELERLTTELEDARKAQPDLAARDAAWQAKVDAAEARVQAAQADVQKVRDESDEEKLENAFLGANLRPRYARLIKREFVGQRLLRKEDGSYEVRDETGIPVKIPAGKTPFQVAAEMARKEAEPADVISDADTGAHITNGNGGGFVTTPPRKEQEAEKRAEIGALF